MQRHVCRESRVGVGEVFGAGGYYINNDYNLGLKKKPNNFVKGWTKIRFKMFFKKKKAKAISAKLLA